MRKNGASCQGGFGCHLPIRSQLIKVSLTLSGELSKCLESDVSDATPFVGEDNLPDVMGLQLLNVQVPSLEQKTKQQVTYHASPWTGVFSRK